jgi:hypothetical protein
MSWPERREECLSPTGTEPIKVLTEVSQAHRMVTHILYAAYVASGNLATVEGVEC